MDGHQINEEDINKIWDETYFLEPFIFISGMKLEKDEINE
jgi:hypothetical protein